MMIHVPILPKLTLMDRTPLEFSSRPLSHFHQFCFFFLLFNIAACFFEESSCLFVALSIVHIAFSDEPCKTNGQRE